MVRFMIILQGRNNEDASPIFLCIPDSSGGFCLVAQLDFLAHDAHARRLPHTPPFDAVRIATMHSVGKVEGAARQQYCK